MKSSLITDSDMEAGKYDDDDDDDPESIHGTDNGYYIYAEKKIVLYPWGENFSFPTTLAHEIIHAIEDVVTGMQGIRDIQKELRKYPLDEAKSVFRCALEMVNPSPHYPDASKWNWDLITVVNSTSSTTILQDDHGNFLFDPIFLELSAFAIEYFCHILFNECYLIKHFQQKLTASWQKRFQHFRVSYGSETCVRAHQLIRASVTEIVRELTQQFHRTRWIKCLVYFHDFFDQK